MKPAVLLMAYGGPDSLDELEPYLLDVRGGRPVSPEFFAEIRQRYATIGGRSPLLDITRAQAAALEARLLEDGSGGSRVYVGMRHWHPYIADAVRQLSDDGFRRVIALCMAPHSSRLSTGAYRKKLQAAVETLGVALDVDFVESWHDNPLFVQSLAEKVRAATPRFSAEALPNLRYIFSAHSLPASILEQGDPYPDQLMRTASLVAEQLNLAPGQWQFCYQSAGAAEGQWLGPDITEVLPQIAATGVKDVLVTPVGFVAEHVEILYDLDVEARAAAKECGVHLERSAALNTSPLFIETLAQLVHQRVLA